MSTWPANRLFGCGDVDKDGWVAHLQGRLAAAGFSPGAIDGFFGDATFSGVTGFQSANITLVVDGIVGNQTWAALTGRAGSSAWRWWRAWWWRRWRPAVDDQDPRRGIRHNARHSSSSSPRTLVALPAP